MSEPQNSHNPVSLLEVVILQLFEIQGLLKTDFVLGQLVIELIVDQLLLFSPKVDVARSPLSIIGDILPHAKVILCSQSLESVQIGEAMAPIMLKFSC